METYLIKLLNHLNIELPNEPIKQLITYKNLLQEWNQKMNLTAIVEDHEIILKHFIDSMTILKEIPVKARVIDVGTGAGFPGLVLKIVRPDIELTLLDSLNKRILFLNEVIKTCGLSNVYTIHGRAEDYGRKIEHREKYDIAVARAVANLSTLSELCLPFVKLNGVFIAMKGNNLEEVDAAKTAINLLGGKTLKIDECVLPDSDIKRNNIYIKKEKTTPPKYPRKAGIPASNPI